MTTLRMPRLVPVALVASSLCGCGDDQAPEAASDLWKRIHELGYRSWARAPGHETRMNSDAPHSDAVDIYVNDVVVSVLQAGEPLAAWPEG